MLHLYKGFGLVCFFVLCQFLSAQVVSVNPVFCTENDSVLITFDANAGNKGLLNATEVYAHTGVITTLSTSGTDWKHVVGNWGTVDNRVKMISIGNNKWTMKFKMKDFYSQGGAFATGEKIKKMAFVFRNADGSKKGANSDGSDVFIDVYENGLSVKFTNTTEKYLLLTPSTFYNLTAECSDSATLQMYVNGNLVNNINNNKTIAFAINSLPAGNNWCIVKATKNSNTVADTLLIVGVPSAIVKTPPTGLEEGANYINDTTVTFILYAPTKQNVFIAGDFNNWKPDTNFMMYYYPAKNWWWRTVTKLKKNTEYAYQYFVDFGSIKTHDPFSYLLLHDNDDKFISSNIYPNLKPYPTGFAKGYVSVIKPGAAAFNWQSTNFSSPDYKKLVIYELHIRDFANNKSFKTIKDSIPYLKRLGINALELMPVNEFEGNNSWGYNVANHMAIDKAYGTINDLKSLIDECHKNGIAVIFDVVFNHAFSQAAICQLYWNSAAFKPQNNNPWVNVDAMHPFNVGYDLNHESAATKYYFKRCTRYLLDEFKIDGFRFDLSKGFTQKNTGADVGAWGAYDISRINIWKDYNSYIKNINANCYTILEHFADNTEEKELSNEGLLFWGKANNEFMEGNMGWVNTSDFGYGISWEHRGWSKPNLVGYAESHDEERMMYKTTAFGNGIAKTNLQHAIYRTANSNAFLLLTPGPKMMWQFQELGYDKSIRLCPDGVTINDNCKVDPKPVLWNYWTQDTNRKKLYYRTAACAYLKNTQSAIWNPNDYELNAAGAFKKLRIWGNGLNTYVIGNFDVVDQTSSVGFASTGMHYDYLSGDSLTVTDVNQSITLKAGEVRVYTTKKIANPFAKEIKYSNNNTGNYKDINKTELTIFPNPSSDKITISNLDNIQKIEILSMDGKIVSTEMGNKNQLCIVHLNNGNYLLKIYTKIGLYKAQFAVNK